MPLKQTGDPSVDFIRAISQIEVDDVHVINQKTAEKALTEEKQRLLKEIEKGDIQSVRDLARRVDRNVSIVSRDLDILYEADLVDFEQDGRSKKPVLAHENVLIEPVVFNGQVTR